jgi:hypothetical protein
MSKAKQLYFVLLAGCVIALASISGVFYLGNTLLTTQSKKLLDKKIELAAQEEEEKNISQAKKDIEKYKDINEIAKSIVPQDKDQAKTVREITNLAAKSGTPVQNISFASSSLGQKATPAPATTGSDGQAKAAQQPPVTQVKAVDGINGVYAMQIDIANNSQNPTSYQSVIKFLQNLENNRRTAHITNITITPDSKNTSSITYTISMQVYIKPEVKK